MKLVLVTDAWQPQVNGVVTTLVEFVRELRDQGHTVEVMHPGLFKTRPCPGYAGIDLAVRPAKALARQADRPHPNPSPEEEGLKCFTAWAGALSRQLSNQGPGIATEQTVLRR